MAGFYYSQCGSIGGVITVLALFYCGCNQFKSLHILFSGAKVIIFPNSQISIANYFLMAV